MILAGSTTYCCNIISGLTTKFSTLKNKTADKSVQAGGEASMSPVSQGALFHSAIKVNILTIPLSVHGHSSCTQNAVKVALTGLQLPKEGRWLPVERCATTVPTSSATCNDQIHESRSSCFALLGLHLIPPSQKEFVPS